MRGRRPKMRKLGASLYECEYQCPCYQSECAAATKASSLPSPWKGGLCVERSDFWADWLGSVSSLASMSPGDSIFSDSLDCCNIEPVLDAFVDTANMRVLRAMTIEVYHVL